MPQIKRGKTDQTDLCLWDRTNYERHNLIKCSIKKPDERVQTRGKVNSWGVLKKPTPCSPGADTETHRETLLSRPGSARDSLSPYFHVPAKTPTNPRTPTGFQSGHRVPANRAPCMSPQDKHSCCIFSLIKSRTHTTTPPPHKQTHNTLLLFSQLCSDIKQGPLRENKHADEERLAGRRGRQHAPKHTHGGRGGVHALCWRVKQLPVIATNYKKLHSPTSEQKSDSTTWETKDYE